MSNNKNLCTRRNVLSLGGAGLLASLLSGLHTTANAEEPSPRPATSALPIKAKSCIMLWMNGGPSHIDTFDPKPGSASGGSFKAISTRQSGVSICEHMPQIANVMDKMALLRGVSSKEGNHQRASELGHTGHVPNPTVQAPAIGAWVARKRPTPGLMLPSFVSLAGPSAGAGFFGNPYDPFVVQSPGELPEDLVPARSVGEAREARRRALLDGMESEFEARTHDPQVASRRALYAKARAMMGSPAVRAFEIGDEPEATRAAYGDTDFGRGCLVARRLVETGVPFVEVALDGWDTHQNGFERVKSRLDILDPAMATLLSDLAARNLLDSTLVVWMGEFGRTPRINGDDGRDHHPGAFSVAMAGGGVRGGVVHGETDADGATVVKDPTAVPDVIATIAQLMGIDPSSEELSPAGRPIEVTQRGKPIAAIL